MMRMISMCNSMYRSWNWGRGSSRMRKIFRFKLKELKVYYFFTIILIVKKKNLL